MTLHECVRHFGKLALCCWYCQNWHVLFVLCVIPVDCTIKLLLHCTVGIAMTGIYVIHCSGRLWFSVIIEIHFQGGLELVIRSV